MVRLEEIKRDAAVNGIKPAQIVRIFTTEFVGENALMIYNEMAGEKVKDKMLICSNEPALSLTKKGMLWVFKTSGERFKLTADVYRTALTHLFEPMMTVHTSNTDPLPHQILIVCELKHHGKALRGVPNDYPSPSKTIMAGFLTRELLMRAVINVARVV
jgi:hypothetical protein